MSNVIAAVVVLLATVVAIVAAAMTVWHASGVIRGIRGSAAWWVNLMPFIAPALPKALDAAGQVHREKMLRWGAICAGCVAAVLIAQYIAQA